MSGIFEVVVKESSRQGMVLNWKMKPSLRATNHSGASLTVVPLSIPVVSLVLRKPMSMSPQSPWSSGGGSGVWVGPLSPVTHRGKGKGGLLLGV